MPQPLPDPADALHRHFGFREFREGQEEIVRAVTGGENALVIMPTGGGKSLCYQLPAMMLPGVTLVVSPLIALMKDQVDALRQRGLPAAFLNSSLTAAEQREVLREMRGGGLKLVYVAPERFRSESFLRTLAGIDLSLFAIDEAHCISQWGHDFRPDYYRIGQSLDALGRPRVLALTATASPAVRADILRCLKLPDARVFVAGFARPNLSLRVRQVQSDREKYDRLRDLVTTMRTGIIYCATRKKVEAVAGVLKQWKTSYVAYHAGMDDATRARAQEAFISGAASVAVATNAFGMGIDRADLRFVAHFEMPGSIEAYYQEVGRAGRDGKPSVCELLFCYPDVRVQEFFLEGSNPSIELIHSVWNVLRSRKDSANTVRETVSEIAARIPGCRNEMAVSSALVVLSRTGAIDRVDTPGQQQKATVLLTPETKARDLPVDRAALDEKERIDRERLRLMIDFAYATRCRQQFILSALGEPNPRRCGSCDRCKSRRAKARRPPATEEESIAVRKLLSCIARMSRRQGGLWSGRFGKQRIVQVLAGSRSKAVTKPGLDSLSTHGILRELGEDTIGELLREAINADLAKVEVGEYPLVTLTEKGELVMKGSRDYEMDWPVLHPAGHS